MLKNNQKNTQQPELAQSLLNHCPRGSEQLLHAWLDSCNVEIRISRDRVSKLGDYRAAQNGNPARISINQGLNPVEFMITLGHELAHFKTLRLKTVRHKTLRFKRVRHNDRVKPHGEEWKAAFRGYINDIIDSGIVSDEIGVALTRCYLKRERIASSSCGELKALLDPEGESEILRLQDIKEGEVFELRGGRRFVRGPKLRVRFRCKEIQTGKLYTIHPMATIVKKPL